MATPDSLGDVQTFEAVCESLSKVDVLETHLSTVSLCGDLAFKVKKSVNLGPPFTDQTDLGERERLCREELVRNQRMLQCGNGLGLKEKLTLRLVWNTNGLYLGVYPIVKISAGSGFSVRKTKDSGGNVVDYAVCMKRFPSESRLDKVLDKGEVTPEMIQEFGFRLAALQRKAKVISKGDDYATKVQEVILSNFDQLKGTELGSHALPQINQINDWLRIRLDVVTPILSIRAQTGMVRELHGDLHCKNLFLDNGKIQVFDCLEFNDDLAQIDVVNDVGFLFMDLCKRGRADLAWNFFDAWLTESGDKDALTLLRIFAVYRAIVRCKIAALSTSFKNDGKDQDFQEYLQLAHELASRNHGGVVAMTGKSGSGKSFWAAKLVPHLGAARIRSDVERKRLFDTKEESHESSAKRQRVVGLYSQNADQATYGRLFQFAESGVLGNELVILDATFLKSSHRTNLKETLERLGARPPIFIHCLASRNLMTERVLARHGSGADPSDATVEVLENQAQDPFCPEDNVIEFRTDLGEEQKLNRLVEIASLIKAKLEI